MGDNIASEDEYSVSDFQNVLCLRNQLINVPLPKLLEVYQDYDAYLIFLDSVAVMSAIDSAFLLFDDSFPEKIHKVIQIHRFSSKDSHISDVINSIIMYLNGIQSYSDNVKNSLKNGYLDYHEDIRDCQMDDNQVFLAALAYDAQVYVALENDTMENITEDDLFLSSINYLLETIPDLFKNSAVQKRVMDKLEELSKTKGFFQTQIREYSKSTISHFQKVKESNSF